MRRLVARLAVITPLLLFFVIGAFFWKGLGLNPRRLPSALVGKPVPDFYMPTLKNPQHFVTQKEFLGHVSLLNVWASWCYSCRAEHPVLMDIHDSHQVKIYGLDYKDQANNAKQWLAGHGDPFVNNIFDQMGEVAVNLGVYGTPETFVIDKKGIIRYRYVGPVSPTVWADDILPIVKRLQR